MSDTDPYAAPVTEEAQTTDPEIAAEVETPAVLVTDAPETEELTVPEGSIKNVLAWVADDRTRAQAALDTENDSDDPRSTLITKLEDILA